MKYICLPIYFQYSPKNLMLANTLGLLFKFHFVAVFFLLLYRSPIAGWPPTYFLAETGLELLIFLTSQVLRLQACITTPDLQTVLTLHWSIRNNNSNKNSTCSVNLQFFSCFQSIVGKVHRHGIWICKTRHAVSQETRFWWHHWSSTGVLTTSMVSEVVFG